MSVQEYLDRHMLSRKIEDAVNAAVRAKTPDPVLFIVISLSLIPLRLFLEKTERKRYQDLLILCVLNQISFPRPLLTLFVCSCDRDVNLQSSLLRKSVPSVITKVKARQILDSRGVPTVEVDLYTNKGLFRASAPSGDASGMYEFFLSFFFFFLIIAPPIFF